MPDTVIDAPALQTELTHYLDFAWDEGSGLLAGLNEAREQLSAAPVESGLSPELFRFTLTENADLATRFRRIELDAAKAQGFVEINAASVGSVFCEITNKQTKGQVFEMTKRLTAETPAKAIEETCHRIVRSLLLA